MKPFTIPTDWNRQQAMAVIDFLDELRCHIWQKYQVPLLAAYREFYGGDPNGDYDPIKPFIEDPIDF